MYITSLHIIMILFLLISLLVLVFWKCLACRNSKRELEKNLEIVETSQRQQLNIKQFYELTLESLPHPFYVVDAHTYKIEFSNLAARKNAPVGASVCYELAHQSNRPCDEGDHICPLKEVKRTGKPMVTRHVHYNTANEPRLYDVYGYPIFDEKGDLSKMIEYSLDVTDKENSMIAQKKLEAHLVESSQLATLGKIVSGVAHEVNNPLAIIVGKTKLALSQIEPGTNNEHILKILDSILLSAHRISSVVQSLREFSFEGDGLKKYLYSVNELVNESLDLLRGRFDVAGVDIQISLLNDDIRVECQKAILLKVIWNLLMNSYEALQDQHNKEIRIIVMKTNENVQIDIIDNGPGVLSDHVPRLMEPFFTTKKAGKNVGLGLYVSQGLMQSQSGNISFESSTQGQTCFRVSLPLINNRSM